MGGRASGNSLGRAHSRRRASTTTEHRPPLWAATAGEALTQFCPGCTHWAPWLEAWVMASSLMPPQALHAANVRLDEHDGPLEMRPRQVAMAESHEPPSCIATIELIPIVRLCPKGSAARQPGKLRLDAHHGPGQKHNRKHLFHRHRPVRLHRIM